MRCAACFLIWKQSTYDKRERVTTGMTRVVFSLYSEKAANLFSIFSYSSVRSGSEVMVALARYYNNAYIVPETRYPPIELTFTSNGSPSTSTSNSVGILAVTDLLSGGSVSIHICLCSGKDCLTIPRVKS